MIGGRLEVSDLTTDEAAVLSIFKLVGRVSAPGASVRGDFITQLVLGSGPVGELAGNWNRIHFEFLKIIDKLDLADLKVTTGLHFLECDFTDADTSLDSSRSDLYDLRLTNCRLVGRCRMENARFRNNLLVTNSDFGGSWTLFQIRVGGATRFKDVRIKGGEEGGVSVDSAEFQGIFVLDGCKSTRGFSAKNVRFNSRVRVANSTFWGGRGAFDFEQAHCRADVQYGPKLTVVGSIRANGLTAAHDVTITGVVVGGDGEVGIALEQTKIEGTLLISDENKIADGIRLGASRYGRLQLARTVIAAPSSGTTAVSADGLSVAQDARIGPRTVFLGDLRFLGAEIGGQLAFDADDKPMVVAFNGEGMTVRGGVLLQELDSRSNVFLADATMASLMLNVVDPLVMSLARTRYQFIGADDGIGITGEQAIALLHRRLLGFSIAPYLTMYQWLKSQGHDESATKVAIEGEREAVADFSARIGQRTVRARVRRVVSWAFDKSVGFGYAPIRAAYLLIGLLVVATAVFGLLYNGELAWFRVAEVSSASQFANTGPTNLFNPLTYASAAIFPTGADWLTTWRPLAVGPELFTLFLRLFGWLLASAVVLGVANRLQR